jgi:membrane protease YdiL (CAAX protease family)
VSLETVQHPTVVVVCLVAAACYIAFHYLAHASRWAARGHGTEAAVHRQRLSGVVLLGVVPALVTCALPGGLTDYGWGLSNPGLALGLAAGISALVLPTIFLASRGPKFREDYPEMHGIEWDRGLRVRNFATWSLYLLAYEFFFRGFLLFPLAAAFGAWPAIAVTTLAYVYAHLPKNGSETTGTLPMGVVFASTSLVTGGFWAPFVVHVLIANFADWLASKE